MSILKIFREIRKYKSDVFCLIFIFALVILFFFQLLFFGSKVFVTPDFVTSDLWHYTFAEKFFLSEGLKHNSFQEYTDLLLNGLSLTADGQIAYLNPLNYFLFKFIPMPLAFNLGYIYSFLLAGFGVYFLGRRMKLNQSSSLLSSIVFIFSGMMIFKISHYTLLQNISYIPLILLTLDTLLTEGKKSSKLLMALILTVLLCLQFSNGQFQITFITLTGIFVYLIVAKFFKIRDLKLLDLFFLLLVLVFLFLISLPEILAVGDLYLHSVRNSNINSVFSLLPSFPPKNILTFVNPFIFGSPKDGSYLKNGIEGDIFWESNLYIGVLPLIFAFSVFFIKKKTLFLKLCIISTIPFFLLSLGKNSPIYLILLIFPFSIFRAPTRFIVLSILFLSILVGFGFQSFQHKFRKLKLFSSVTILITIVDLLLSFYAYHPVVDYQKWIKEPETVSYLKNISNNKYFSIGFQQLWSNNFKVNGWKDIEIYKFLQNSLDPKLNLIYKIPAAQTFTSSFFISEDDFNYTRFIYSGININNSSMTISNGSLRYLGLLGVNYIIVPYDIKPLNENKLSKVFETKKVDGVNLSAKIYKLNDVKGDIYYANNIYYYSSLSEFKEKATKTLNGDVLLKDLISLNNESLQDNQKKELKLIKKLPSKIEIKTKLEKPNLLVVNRTYSNHWKALIDNSETLIYKANWKALSIIVPQGEHKITFEYDFPALRYLVMLKQILLGGIIAVIFFLILRKFQYTF